MLCKWLFKKKRKEVFIVSDQSTTFDEIIEVTLEDQNKLSND